MRGRTISIALCLCLSPSTSYAQACADGRQVTITGTIAKKKELGELGKKLESKLKQYSDPGVSDLDVASSAPCQIDMLMLKGTAPAACVGGASFKASGRILDMVGTFLNVTSISCR